MAASSTGGTHEAVTRRIRMDDSRRFVQNVGLVIVLITPRAIEKVADRIERAYARRHPQGIASPPDSRLWDVVARALVEAHRVSPWLPLDPELFVASQPTSSPLADPWESLAPVPATRRYRRRILQIVRSLRRELRGEIRSAEAQLRRGRSPESVLRRRTRTLSPLGCYLIAYRIGRPDLAARFQAGAQDQHAACPLYRLACRGLVSDAAYPVLELLPGLVPTRRVGPRAPRVCPN